MNPSIRTGLLRLRHLREVTEAKGEEMDEQRQRFDAMREAQPTKAISSFNLFQTPASVSNDMHNLLGPIEGLRILEPSAGLGRLYRPCGEWVLVEQDTQCCEQLYKLGVKLIQDDFLACDTERLGGKFDRVIMNPPFKMGRDIKHIKHAYQMLKSGGLLVALCYNGVKQNKHLKPVVDSWDVLPEESFKSEGTKASVAILTWRKQ